MLLVIMLYSVSSMLMTWVYSSDLFKYFKVMIRPAETMSSPGKIKAIFKCVFNSQT